MLGGSLRILMKTSSFYRFFTLRLREAVRATLSRFCFCFYSKLLCGNVLFVIKETTKILVTVYFHLLLKITKNYFHQVLTFLPPGRRFSCVTAERCSDFAIVHVSLNFHPSLLASQVTGTLKIANSKFCLHQSLPKFIFFCPS